MAGVTGKMRSYQIEALNWLISLHDNNSSGVLADEMGLGKTLESLSLLAYLKHYRKQEGPHLIIVSCSATRACGHCVLVADGHTAHAWCDTWLLPLTDTLFAAAVSDCCVPKVPKSTSSNWIREMTRWTPVLTKFKFHGSKDERVGVASWSLGVLGWLTSL